MSSDKTLNYFAYGSNLLFARLYARTPSIKNLGIAKLTGHRLRFDKPGGDGSGKCGIEAVESPSFVLGVVYQMDVVDKPVLDEIEGVGHGYVDRKVDVELDSNLIAGFTYYPTALGYDALPFDWYREFVLQGAIENGFPQAYVEMIKNQEFITDSDEVRRAENFNIISAQHQKLKS